MGRLSADLLVPAIAALSADEPEPVPLSALYEELRSIGGSTFTRLADHIESDLIRRARAHVVSGAPASGLAGLNLPLPGFWMECAEGMAALAELLRAAQSESIEPAGNPLSELPLPWEQNRFLFFVQELLALDLLDEKTAAFLHAESLAGVSGEDEELHSLVAEFNSAGNRREQESAMDSLLAWPTERAAPYLLEICQLPWAKLRCAVALTHRFALDACESWSSVESWLRTRGMSSLTLDAAIAAMQKGLPAVSQSVVIAAEPEPIAPAAIEPPPKPAKPSVWQTHLQPFFADNWYIFSGLMMLIVGCSIVAYYTWDEHWLWRFTLLPLMLAGFTFGLAGLGTWLEKKDEDFQATVTSLRGAAIGLLPVNFMTVALLAREEEIEGQGKIWLLLVAALMYLAVFGWGLRAWCLAVYRPMGSALAGALLLANALVITGPVAGTLPGTPIPVVLGTGFYLGFLGLAAVVVHFARQHLSLALAAEKRVPWFVGGTLVVTFLQVFAWVHASLGLLPQVHTYSIMVILAGGLVLLVERRVLELRADLSRHSGESFLGFALVLLGSMMALSQPSMRIFGFVMAGLVWLYQARGRRHEAHQWIGLILIALGLASIGMLPGVSRGAGPVLGFAIAALMHSIGIWGAARGDADLARAASGMRNSAVILTAVVAILSQWQEASEPLVTAGCLALAAGILIWRAHVEDRQSLMHAAMVVVGLILPYIGCVDLAGQSIHGNTMVFGLAIVSILWLLQNWLLPSKTTRRARSTVLWSYGALAVVGMVLRVVIERGTAGDVLWYQQAMDYSGPLLMSGVLVVASYLSRSLIPSGMAAVIVVILFPELKARFEETFANLGWGTGLGSANSSLVLVIAAFFLRRWSFLADLRPGDRFLDRFEFPLRRFDHTLFTWPLLASAIFLVCRTETWTLYKNIAAGMSTQSAVAILVTGATWTLVAAYCRKHGEARVATHLGWIWLGLGLGFLHWELSDAPRWDMPLLQLLILLTVFYSIYRSRSELRDHDFEKILTIPTLRVLAAGSILVSSFVLVFSASRTPDASLGCLAAFLAVQLFWHALRSQKIRYGATLFALTLALLLSIWSTSGWFSGVLRQSEWGSLASPVIVFLIAVQLGHILLERSEIARQGFHCLVQPFQVGSLLVTIALVGLFAMELDSPGRLDDLHRAMVLLLLVLCGRNWNSGPALLAAALLGYAWTAIPGLAEGDPRQRIEFLLTPWHLALFAAAVSSLACFGLAIQAQASKLVDGTWPVLPYCGSRSDWLLATGTTGSCLATFLILVSPEWRGDSAQLLAPYLGVLTLALSARLWKQLWPGYGAVVLFAIGNVQAVRLFLGDSLLGDPNGISEVHLICLGLVATVMPIALGCRRLADANLREAAQRATMALAGATLLLLVANYLVRHNLQDISSFRFGFSGVIAYAAALAFRQVARLQSSDKSYRAEFCESAYHFGVTIALWCAALLIPALRGPQLALFALSVPLYYFAVRAEMAWRLGQSVSSRYRTSAAGLGCVLLGLYAARAAFQVALFPDTVVQTEHYHHGSPYVMVIGLILLRMFRLGGSYWLAFYGGLALIVGSYFAVTSFPDLRPFDHIIAGAWVGIVMAHFWSLATTQRSPLRAGLQSLGGVGDEDWAQLRSSWGFSLFAATQILALLAAKDHGDDPQAVAPILLGAASIALHHGVLRRRLWYFVLAAVQVLIAVHADLFVASYLDRQDIIWVLLALWGIAIAALWFFRGAIGSQRGGGLVLGGLAVTIFAHVIYHDPSSSTALWAVALLGLTAPWIPRPGVLASLQDERLAAWLLLLVPTWLAYFGQVSVTNGRWSMAFEAWPVLLATAATLVTSVLAHLCQSRFSGRVEDFGGPAPMLIHQLLNLLRRTGTKLFLANALGTLLTVGCLQMVHYGQAFADRELGLLCLLYAALAWIAWCVAHRLQSAIVFALMELCLAAMFLAVRRQFLLTTEYWQPEYDVWASLITAVLLTGLKQAAGPQPRMVNQPIAVSLLVLPVVAMGVTLVNGLGTDVTLIVVGLHSLMFAFLGKDDRHSPYNILAVLGFVSFVLIVFATKLELSVLHAYVVPVGLGILLLLQLFRERISAGQRGRIRMVTVLAMLGSSGYYAVIDPRYPIGFNLTLLILALLAMGLGGFLRIRIYLSLGFAGLLVSLGSIVYRGLAGLERTGRMTAVGFLVLVIGAALVAGAIYYKTHRVQLSARLDAWRQRFGEWE